MTVRAVVAVIDPVLHGPFRTTHDTPDYSSRQKASQRHHNISLKILPSKFQDFRKKGHFDSKKDYVDYEPRR